MGYLGYYFAWMLLSYGLRQPWLLGGVVVLWLLRGFIPRPGALFGALGRAGRLRQQVSVNRANITARRDLATLYLDLLRPRRALELLEEGLALASTDAELLYLSGVALLRVRRYQDALDRLLLALDKDQRLRHGHPYLVAGDALLGLERWDDAIDAYERFLDFNSSDVAGHTQLARAQAGAKNSEATQKALLAGIQTWHSLPGPLKRRQFGAYLRAQWARITVLKDVRAMLFAAVGVALVGFGARAAYPFVARLWAPDPPVVAARERLFEGFRLCGTQRTGDFAGRYEAEPELESRGNLMPQTMTPEQREAMQAVLENEKRQYANFEIQSDRIVSGTGLVQEFCLSKVLQRTPQLLRAQAVWHEDRDDPGDAAMVEIQVTRGGQGGRFSFALLDHPLSAMSARLRKLQ